MLTEVVQVKQFNDYGFECWGLFAKEDLPKGTLVWYAEGHDVLETFTKAEILAHPEQETLITYSYMRGDDKFCSTLNPSSDPSWYFNHSCMPTCWYEGDERITTCRDVKKGEQLAYDYSCTETESSMHYGLRCLCGTAACRGVLTFSEWRSRAYVRKNKGHLNDYVWEKHAENSWYDSRTEVRAKGGDSRGLFARIQKDAVIKAGEIVVVFSGKIVHRNEVSEPGAISKRDLEMSLQVAPDLWQIPSWKESGEKYDTSDFINHSCDPSCGMWDSVTVVAIRDIHPGDEITIDYAMVNDGSINTMTTGDSDAFECQCHSANCRGNVTPSDWKLPEVQARIGQYFAPFVKDLVRRRAHVSP
ncbi:hypothetical protein H257_03987 [Aphanomyces astaci]|uniref:SET domain-containing protein n=2 Tax=Aphanomyces astaci TaxID=112090 RepID=W4GTZ8_APHAT|nr:hypothetical protein H257_03987 [Aphanomyces astaci]ETV83200.1 hypothetical protein H257_03987 [Aphanomyces astaci]RHY89553.1 hypothetical protein DYB35_011994 [Aphanomyces astaci]RHZ03521.1 hypothetical protein DYB37_012238 [Aphanomyces astaci]RQM22992.1 hypothetical protein B5M09_003530 [Aphanomyces astaci]|eukprot:XP_009826630.1 hypothetical protein H257_03987 [Aphanomyces astaci]